jgi:hypothetical protein
MTVVELFALVFVLSGVWLIAKPDIKGLWLMFLAQICWMMHSYNTAQIALGFQSFVLLLINIRGILNWRKKGI